MQRARNWLGLGVLAFAATFPAYVFGDPQTPATGKPIKLINGKNARFPREFRPLMPIQLAGRGGGAM